MPGLMSKSTDLTVFYVTNPAAVTAESLKQFAFQPIDALPSEEQAKGWTSIEDMMDTTWEKSVPEKGEWFCFALRVDKRKVPPAVLKKRYEEACKKGLEDLTAQGKSFLPRGRKGELKAQVKMQLLANAEPAPATVDLALHCQTGKLFIGTTSKSMLDHVADLMAVSFGVQPLPLEAPENCQQVLRAIYDGEVLADFGGHQYILQNAEQVTLAGYAASDADASIEVTSKNDRASADAGLTAGLSIGKLKISMMRASEELTWSFSLSSKLQFTGLKIPAVAAKEGDDPDAVLLEHLYLLETTVGTVLSVFEIR